MKNILYILQLILFFVPKTTAQQYFGGIGSGMASVTLQNRFLFVSSKLYEGGSGSGQNSLKISSQNLGIKTAENVLGSNGPGAYSLNMANLPLFKPNGYATTSGGPGQGHIQLPLKYLNLAICTNQYTWNGNVSSFWGNNHNWSCGTVPTTTSIVTIPAGLVNYPSIFTTQSIRLLTLGTNATLKIEPPLGKLNILGPQ